MLLTLDRTQHQPFERDTPRFVPNLYDTKEDILRSVGNSSDDRWLLLYMDKTTRDIFSKYHLLYSTEESQLYRFGTK